MFKIRNSAFIIPVILFGMILTFSGCDRPDDTLAQSLLEQAQEQLETADSFDKGTCSAQSQALTPLLEVGELSQKIAKLDCDDDIKSSASNLAALADNQYHQVIKVGFKHKCCWAVQLIIGCAENNIDQLESEQLCGLAGVKEFYSDHCIARSRPLPTATSCT